VVGRSLGGALALVPVWGARGGSETATVRAPRRLGGGSRRARAGVGVLAGCARANQGGEGASQGPPWSLPRVNMAMHGGPHLSPASALLQSTGERIFTNVEQLRKRFKSAAKELHLHEPHYGKLTSGASVSADGLALINRNYSSRVTGSPRQSRGRRRW